MLTPENCPRCESEQGFIPKLRETEHRWQEIYIRCTVCRWESVLQHTTPELQTIEKRLLKLNRAMDDIEQRHSQSPATWIKQRRTLRREWSRLRGELTQEIRDSGSTAANANAT